jgi:hypothetical protein
MAWSKRLESFVKLIAKNSISVHAHIARYKYLHLNMYSLDHRLESTHKLEKGTFLYVQSLQ